jgi:hypothetical protein
MLIFCYLIFELNTYIKLKYPQQQLKKWLKYTWPLILVYGFYGFGYLNLVTLFQNATRYVNFKVTESQAQQGDVLSQLKIKANKFVNGYKFHNDDWLENLKNSDIEISDNVKLLYQKTEGNIGYYVIKNSGNVFQKSEKLFFNDKFIDLKSPNEDLRNWHHNKFIVLKLKNIGIVKTGKIQ